MHTSIRDLRLQLGGLGLAQCLTSPDSAADLALVLDLDLLTEPVARLNKLVQVHTSLEAEFVQRVHYIFRRHIACSAGRVGAASETCQRRINDAQAKRKERQNAGERHGKGVVTMSLEGSSALPQTRDTMDSRPSFRPARRHR